MFTESEELKIREGSFVEDHPMRRIRYNDDFTLDVLYWNGETRHFDMKEYAKNWPYCQNLLRDLSLFQHPYRNTVNAIDWDDKADITSENIYYMMCQDVMEDESGQKKNSIRACEGCERTNCRSRRI